MRKDEILEKSRQENKQMDERERQHDDKSWRFVYTVIIIAVLIYDILNLSLENYHPVIPIIIQAGFSTKWFYDYIVNKKTSSLVVAIIAAVCYIGWMALFLMNRFNLWEIIR